MFRAKNSGRQIGFTKLQLLELDTRAIENPVNDGPYSEPSLEQQKNLVKKIKAARSSHSLSNFYARRIEGENAMATWVVELEEKVAHLEEVLLQYKENDAVVVATRTLQQENSALQNEVQIPLYNTISHLHVIGDLIMSTS